MSFVESLSNKDKDEECCSKGKEENADKVKMNEVCRNDTLNYHGMSNNNEVKTLRRDYTKRRKYEFQGKTLRHSNKSVKQIFKRDLIFNNIKRDLTQINDRVNYFTKNIILFPKRPSMNKEIRHVASQPKGLKERINKYERQPLCLAEDSICIVNNIPSSKGINPLVQIKGKSINGKMLAGGYSVRNMKRRMDEKRKRICIRIKMYD